MQLNAACSVQTETSALLIGKQENRPTGHKCANTEKTRIDRLFMARER